VGIIFKFQLNSKRPAGYDGYSYPQMWRKESRCE